MAVLGSRPLDAGHVQAVVFERVFKKVFKVGPPDAAAVEKGLASFNRAAIAILDGRLDSKDFTWPRGHPDTRRRHRLPARARPRGGRRASRSRATKRVRRWLSVIEKLDAWKVTSPGM